MTKDPIMSEKPKECLDRRDLMRIMEQAHGGGAGQDSGIAAFRFYSYRDPRLSETLADFDRLIGADGSDVMAYDDPAGGHGRRVRVQGDVLWTARLSGRTAGAPASAGLQASAHWLRGLMTGAVPVRPLSRWLLSPVAPPQSAFAPRDPIVCVCHGVGARAIDAALAKATGSASQRLAALQSGLRCGTSCGSCVPELRARAQAIDASPDPAAASAAERIE